MTPTDEQIAIVEIAREGNSSMAVKAFAGTGKTTTLSLLAEASPARRVLYLAFNKSIAEDAKGKMPRKVTSRTFHSLAYGAMGMGEDSRKRRLDVRLNGRYMADHFSVPKTSLGGKQLAPQVVGDMALAALSRFYSSSAADLSDRHVPSLDATFSAVPDGVGEGDSDWRAIRAMALSIAQRAWIEQCDDHSSFPLTHDTYVKQWALTDPVIDTDLILFDEAQDASPVFMAIVDAQRCPVVWVGDQHQQIYAWRGAVDALDRVRVDHSLHLTKSYRFGPEIAETATRLLRALGESRPLIGAGPGTPTKKDRAILTRTNARAMEEFMTAVSAREDVAFVGAREMLNQMRQLKRLMDGQSSGAFALFASWTDLVEHSKTDAGRDLAAIVSAVDSWGIDTLIQRLDAAGDGNRSAALTISTIHKAKGREWDYVELTGDWPGSAKKPKELSDEDLRLMYVGVTRAKVAVATDEVSPWLPKMKPFVAVKPEPVTVMETEIQQAPEQLKPQAQTDAQRVAAHRASLKAEGKRRVELALTSDAIRTLDDLASASSCTRAEVIERLLTEANQ